MASEQFRVLILGYGEMGHAMERLLAARHTLTLWQRQGQTALEASVPASDIILFCLPATAHAGIAARVAPQLAATGLCLTIAKGLDDQGRLPLETLSAAIGREHAAVVYGPMIAEEICAGRPAFADAAAGNPEAMARIQALFHGSALRIEPASDSTGLSWSAILKNVYAIAFGMADELQLGDNVRGFLTVTALDELARLVHQLGGARQTPYSLAGLGDLITTATSSGSHHHELGRLLARGDRHAINGEGVHTLAMLRAHPRFATDAFPLFRLIADCVREPQDVRARFTTLLFPSA